MGRGTDTVYRYLDLVDLADFLVTVGFVLRPVLPAALPVLFAAVREVVPGAALLAGFCVDLVVVFRVVFFAVFLAAFGAGPLAAFSAISETACSSVTASGLTLRGNVALIAPCLT